MRAGLAVFWMRKRKRGGTAKVGMSRTRSRGSKATKEGAERCDGASGGV